MKVVTLVSLEYTKDGKRTEGVPGSIVTLKDSEAKSLIDAGHARAPTEAEEALYDRQNPSKVVAEEVKQNDAASAGNTPVKTQTEPAEPNGAGGASGETDQANSSVATDTNTVAAGEQGKQSASSQGEGSASTTTAKKTAKRKDDLA